MTASGTRAGGVRLQAEDLLAWQLVDSAFPTGSFAHSGGLEAAWQSGEIPNLAALEGFAVAVLEQTGHGTLPLLNAAYVAAAFRWGYDLCHYKTVRSRPW